MRVSQAIAAATGLVAMLVTGPAAAEVRRVGNVTTISEIDLSGRFKVEIVQGAQAGAILEGAPDALERLGVRYSEGRLKIWEKCTMFCGRHEVDAVIRIVSPRLDVIEVAKGAEVTAAGVYGPSLSLDVSMGGSLAISGQCEGLEADVAMGGVLSAENLSCRAVEVDASMGGAAGVRASELVDAVASMGGAIAIHGKPRLDSHASMGGVVSMED